jgi:hypothetical protein
MTIEQVLEQAKQASIAKSLEIWERDGKQDCGSCGGAIMYLDSRTKLAKIAVATGYARDASGDIAVNQFLGEGVCTQNADIYQDSMYAFKQVLEANGYGKAIKRFWDYVDQRAMDARGADQWHAWFAWYPVRLYSVPGPRPSWPEPPLAWLRTIERARFFDVWLYRSFTTADGTKP